MIARNTTKWLATLMLISACTTTARAQNASGPMYSPYGAAGTDTDAEWFAPVDFDFENRPMRKSSGYFFNYEKLNWAITGERHTIGASATSQASMNPYRVFLSGGGLIPNPDPDGDEDFIPAGGTIINIAPPTMVNGINSAPPRSDFAWGERYELGYWEKDNGWLIGILDGPNAISERNFGFGFTGQDETVNALGVVSNLPSGVTQSVNPLGSVLVVFDDPQNLMMGFLDVLDFEVPSGTGGAFSNDDLGVDGILDGDGIADDIDEDGQHGPDGFDTETPAWEPDARFLTVPPDFDDLVQLPTSFQTLQVRNSTKINGIELMRTHRLNNRHRMAKNQNNEFEFTYGARYLRLKDNFLVNGSGGVLGDSFWDTTITNNLVGPQVGLRWLHQKNRFRFDWSGRCLLGYNVQNFEQDAALGEDLITGAHNHPLYFPPTVSHHGKEELDFSPVVEMRVQTSYQLTNAVALKLGYTATFVDNIRRASQHVKYELPNMGFRDGGTQDIFVNGLNFGFDLTY